MPPPQALNVPGTKHGHFERKIAWDGLGRGPNPTSLSGVDRHPTAQGSHPPQQGYTGIPSGGPPTMAPCKEGLSAPLEPNENFDLKPAPLEMQGWGRTGGGGVQPSTHHPWGFGLIWPEVGSGQGGMRWDGGGLGVPSSAHYPFGGFSVRPCLQGLVRSNLFRTGVGWAGKPCRRFLYTGEGRPSTLWEGGTLTASNRANAHCKNSSPRQTKQQHRQRFKRRTTGHRTILPEKTILQKLNVHLGGVRFDSFP